MKLLKSTYRNLNNFLKKYSTGKIVLLSFIVTQIVYFCMIFYTIPSVMEYSDGLKLLDMQPTGYSAYYVQNLFDTLGHEGRAVYLWKQIPFDMIYPLLFSLAYSLLLTYFFKRGFEPHNPIQTLHVIPILGGFFDYLENVGIIIMLSSYPDFSIYIAKTTNIFTILKSLFTTVFFLLLICGIGAVFKKRIQRK